jgi:hypothetical protein
MAVVLLELVEVLVVVGDAEEAVEVTMKRRSSLTLVLPLDLH